MPKVPINNTTAIVTLLQSNLARLDWLLRGNIDDNNFQENTAGTSYKIPSKKISDYADDTREVSGMKFFANTSSATEMGTFLFQPLLDLVNNSTNYIVLKGNASWVLNSDTNQASFANPFPFKLENEEDFFQKAQISEFKVTQTNNLAKRISIQKPVQIKALRDANNEIIFNIQKFSVSKNVSTANEDIKFSLNKGDETYDEITFDCSVETVGLTDSEFLTCDLEIAVLCEVLK